MKTHPTRWFAAIALVSVTLFPMSNVEAYGLCRAPRQPGCLNMMDFAKDEASIRACRMEVDSYRQQVTAYLRCITDEVNAERIEQSRNAERARERIACFEQARGVCF